MAKKPRKTPRPKAPEPAMAPEPEPATEPRDSRGKTIFQFGVVFFWFIGLPILVSLILKAIHYIP